MRLQLYLVQQYGLSEARLTGSPSHDPNVGRGVGNSVVGCEKDWIRLTFKKYKLLQGIRVNKQIAPVMLETPQDSSLSVYSVQMIM